jgi:sugar lactone lactonase YvrE
VEFEPVARGIYLEGLAVEGDTVWFTDVFDGGVQRRDPDGTLARWLPEREWIGAVGLNGDGALLLSGFGGIVWVDPESGRSGSLVDSVGGRPLLGANEMCSDGNGGIYFGEIDLPAIEGRRQPGPVALHHLAADGTTRTVATELVFCNGVGLSEDGGTLYHNESFVGTFAYPVLDDGSLGERQKLLEKEDVDGLVFDVDGNLWITGFSSNDVICVTPEGEVADRVSVPAGAVTNIRFGGADGRDLYVTTVPLEAGMEIAAGRWPTAPDSVLYRTQAPVAGRIPPRPEFALVAA